MRKLPLTKRVLRAAIKVVAAIAGVAFILPTSITGFLWFAVSLVVLLVCFLLWKLLEGDDDSGYWPDEPAR